ncbi:uncharacterized protein LOC120278480 [Dioscorea cayenensis subsp. rotundata]|uniref:Uncharacterized protein LOC120278480 n=1 Tax=Dioscorea cayennensis subsp. rotundata TaxID=55577 RepID=A0AB40CME0_DIOCR|nr:uncharacterized protein LOC120278480 [Dioscorea cayenensis subsp. rotundata]
MIVEEVIGSLKAHEEQLWGYDDEKEEHILLTKAEWKAREEGEGTSNSLRGQEENNWRGRGRGRGRSDDRSGNEGTHQEKKFDKTKVKPYNCHYFGHYAYECRSKKKDEEAYLVEKQDDNDDEPTLLMTTHLVEKQDDDDEPVLLMTEVCEPLQDMKHAAEEIMLHEVNIKPSVRTKEIVYGNNLWYLDMGASNHMTGSRSQFSELDETIVGRVKFGDDSVVDIQGKGTIMFQCQNGEHRLLTDVYFIPSLCSNIVSLGQLDEHGCESVIKGGYLCVYDKGGRLFARVKRSKNRLYILNVKDDIEVEYDKTKEQLEDVLTKPFIELRDKIA